MLEYGTVSAMDCIERKFIKKIDMDIEDVMFFKKHAILLIQFHFDNNFFCSNVVAVDDNDNVIWRSKFEDGMAEGLVQINESRFQLIYKDKYIIYYIVNGEIKETFRKHIHRRKKAKSYEKRKQSILNKFFS